MDNKTSAKGDFTMKKKLIAAMLTAGMCLSLVACGTNDAADNNTETENVADTEVAPTENNTEDTGVDTPAEEDSTTGEDQASLGQSLYNMFVNIVSENPDAASADIASELIGSDMILFSGDTMAVEPGLLTGFGNEEITGFEDGTMFAPIIGSIPFVGYIFTLGDDTDVDSFKQMLSDNANPRWNVCTEADETVIENVGNKVFFVMCPLSLED